MKKKLHAAVCFLMLAFVPIVASAQSAPTPIPAPPSPSPLPSLMPCQYFSVSANTGRRADAENASKAALAACAAAKQTATAIQPQTPADATFGGTQAYTFPNGIAPPGKHTLLCVVGDSISQLSLNMDVTYTSGSQANWPHKTAALLGGTDLWNMGASGHTASDLFTDLRMGDQQPVLPNNCDVLVLEDGTNDEGLGVAFSYYQTLLNAIVAYEPSTTKYVIFTVHNYGDPASGGCYQVSPLGPPCNPLNITPLNAFNANIRSAATALASTRSVTLFPWDTDARFYPAYPCTSNANACWPDYTHPNGVENTFIASVLAPMIAALSPGKSSNGAVQTVNSLGITDTATKTIVQAGDGHDLVLLPGVVPSSAPAQTVFNVDVNPGTGINGALRVFDQRNNMISITPGSVKFPLQQYVGAGPPNVTVPGEFDIIAPSIKLGTAVNNQTLITSRVPTLYPGSTTIFDPTALIFSGGIGAQSLSLSGSPVTAGNLSLGGGPASGSITFGQNVATIMQLYYDSARMNFSNIGGSAFVASINGTTGAFASNGSIAAGNAYVLPGFLGTATGAGTGGINFGSAPLSAGQVNFDGTTYNFIKPGGSSIAASINTSTGQLAGAGTIVSAIGSGGNSGQFCMGGAPTSASCMFFDSANVRWTNVGGTAYTMTLGSNSGNLTISGTLTQASQRKLKNRIARISAAEATQLLRATRVVRFCYIHDHCKPGEQGRHLGVIADDTNTLLAPAHKAVDVGGMAALSLRASQIVDAQVQSLARTRTAVEAQLRKRVSALERAISDLQRRLAVPVLSPH